MWGDSLTDKERCLWESLSASMAYGDTFVKVHRLKQEEPQYRAPAQSQWLGELPEADLTERAEQQPRPKPKMEDKYIPVTIKVSGEHAVALLQSDFEGELPPDVLLLEDRVEWLVYGYTNSLILEDAEAKMWFYRRRRELREKYR